MKTCVMCVVLFSLDMDICTVFSDNFYISSYLYSIPDYLSRGFRTSDGYPDAHRRIHRDAGQEFGQTVAGTYARQS